jgi:acyl-CoA hydrolase
LRAAKAMPVKEGVTLESNASVVRVGRQAIAVTIGLNIPLW